MLQFIALQPRIEGRNLSAGRRGATLCESVDQCASMPTSQGFTPRQPPQGRMLLAFQSIAPGDDFKFAPHCVLNRDYRVHLEHK
jgi:hypothetical protein